MNGKKSHNLPKVRSERIARPTHERRALFDGRVRPICANCWQHRFTAEQRTWTPLHILISCARLR